MTATARYATVATPPGPFTVVVVPGPDGEDVVLAVGAGGDHDRERPGWRGDGGVPCGGGHQALLGRDGAVGRVKSEGTASAHRCITA